MFVSGKSRTVFFPSDTLIYGFARDGYKNLNICTCEHMILGQLRTEWEHIKQKMHPCAGGDEVVGVTFLGEQAVS